MLCQYLDKIVLREAGYQANTTCGNLQLSVVLKAVIERETNVVEKIRQERGYVWVG